MIRSLALSRKGLLFFLDASRSSFHLRQMPLFRKLGLQWGDPSSLAPRSALLILRVSQLLPKLLSVIAAAVQLAFSLRLGCQWAWLLASTKAILFRLGGLAAPPTLRQPRTQPVAALTRPERMLVLILWLRLLGVPA